MTVESNIDRFQDVPREARRTWREHMGLFAAADDFGAAVLVHFMLDPVRREGIFTLVAWVDGTRVKDIDRAPIPGELRGLTTLATRRLTYSVEADGQRARIRYASEALSLDLVYDARFPPHRAPEPGDGRLFPVDNEQQAVEVRGEITHLGRTRAFVGRGSRDHSWGWFPEWPFRAHDWLTVSLPDAFLHVARSERLTREVNAEGYVVDRNGFRALQRLEFVRPFWRADPQAHLPPLDEVTRLVASDRDGNALTVELRLAETTFTHHMNKRDRQLHRMYEQATLFCRATMADGREGTALLEVGKLLERPGVCDEVLPGTAPASARS